MSAASDDSWPNDRPTACVAKPRPIALAPCGKTLPRQCSEKARPTPRSCLSASSPETRKTSGRPFVGPAGLLFDRALAKAGVDRRRVYVTNAVKHFKFEPRGKRRLHKRPNASEIKICRRWLSEEIELIHPRLIVALGATAAQGLAERAIPVQSNRGKVLDVANGLRVFITIHPSALLRLQDDEERHSAYAAFVNDLRAIEQLAKASASHSKSAVRAGG